MVCSCRRFIFRALTLALAALASGRALSADDAPTHERASAALRKAAQFFHEQLAVSGGYVWHYSGDLRLRAGEGTVGRTTVWVQPPGTPAVGEAFLRAYRTLKEPLFLNAARDAAKALVGGQLRTGGWFYRIEFDPEDRRAYAFRDQPKRRKQQSKSTLDDDTTQAAIRFLIQVDQALGGKDRSVRESVKLALDALLAAQYPNGGWKQWWDRYPQNAGESEFPVLAASYPERWSRKWLNDWTGRYYLNDNVMGNTIETLLLAHGAYKQGRLLRAARRGGQFLILAQMPDPQPAWAQQYDVNMCPAWDRKFEPPAISGGESQAVLDTLMTLYEYTGERTFLEPVPRAIAYLKKSRLSDGRLARFYELKTNRPLYFKRTGKRYDLTYSADDLPTHYGFIVASKLDRLERRYRELTRPADKPGATDTTKKRRGPSAELTAAARRVIDSLDDRGAWVERQGLRFHKVKPASGVINSQTFIDNVEVLCRYLDALP